MTQSVAVAGIGAVGVRARGDLRGGLLESTALVAVMPGSVLRRRLQRLRAAVGSGIGSRTMARKAIVGALALGAMFASQNVAAHTDALGFIISDDLANPGKYSAEIIYGTYNHGGTPSPEGSAEIKLNGVSVATQAFALIPGYVGVANGVIPMGLTIGTNYFFVNSSTGGLVTTPFGSGTSQFQAATFNDLGAGTYSFGYVPGALSQQWTPLSDAINAGSFTITASGNLGGIGGVTVTPDIDTAIGAYTTTQLAAGTVNPNFTGGTLTVMATGPVTNGFTIGTGGGTINTAGNTLTASGAITNATGGTGALTVSGGGKLILSGANTYTGGTIVNGGVLQLNTTTAAGTGAIHMVDPTLVLNATGTYANEIRLEATANPASGDPTFIQNTSGGSITITGQVHETGIGTPGQYVTFDGGSDQLSNTANTWAGVTTINSGTTLGGATDTISGGSIVDNGALIYNAVAASGTSSQAISGGGTIDVTAPGIVTLNGNITTSGTVSVSGTGSTLAIGGTRSGSGGGADSGYGSGVLLNGTGATVSVASTGAIQGGAYIGVRVTGAGDTITNLGAITNTGTSGNDQVGAAIADYATSGTLTINNGSSTNATALLEGQNNGIDQRGSSTSAITLNNYGRVTGDTYSAIENSGSAGLLTVNNYGTGAIYANNSGNGINANGAGGVSVTNAGKIVGVGNGVSSAASATIVNTGTIASGTYNSATTAIALGSGSGVNLANGGTVQNNGGTIEGGTQAGIYSSAGTLSVTNSGAITTAGTGSVDGITSQGKLTLGNTASGTITAASASGVAFVGTSSSITNAGTITGGSNATYGYGVQAAGGASGTITNQSGGTLTGGTGGIGRLGTGAVAIDNSGVISGTGATSYGINVTGGTGTILNQIGGVIVGKTDGIVSNGTVSISNAGKIGTGTAAGNGNITVGGAGFGVQAASVAIVNSGTIQASGASIDQTSTAGTLNLVNTGTIGGTARTVDPDDTIVAAGTAQILNGGTISTPNFYALDMQNGGTLTNAAAGQIAAGSAGNRSAVFVTNASATINNYGSITSTGNATSNGAGTNDAISRGIISDNHATTINLFAGSTTGTIATGSANDTLTLYNGRGTTAAATTTTYTDAVAGTTPTMTLQNAGTLAAATVGAVNLGGGTNTLTLAGTGDGTSANGVVGTLNVTSLTNVTNLVKQDAGTWMITGSGPIGTGTTPTGPAANPNFTGGTTVLAGTLAVETNTSTYGSNALGSGAVAISTGATVRYDNPYGTGSLGPSGGQIYVSSNQVTGTGTLAFTGGAGSQTVLDHRNSSTEDVALGVGGVVAVQSGAVLAIGTGVFAGNQARLDIASNASFDGASDVITIDALTGGGLYTGTGTLQIGVAGGSGTFNGTIANEASALSVTKTGAGTETLTGTSTYTGATTISGGKIALSGTGSIANTSVADNAAFDISALTNGGTSIVGLTGTGTVALGANTLTLTNANGTFSGVIANSGGSVTGVGGGLTVSGGAQTLSGVNTYTGTTSVTGIGTTLTLSGGNAIADTGAVSIGSGATLALANSEQVGTANGAGNISLGTNTLVLGTGNGNSTLSGVIAGSGGISQFGTGTLTLSGANTYTGTTSISGSNFVLGASNVLADGSTLYLSNAAVGNIGANSDTIATLFLFGSTLTGTTGVLTATNYDLSNGMLNARTGTGHLYTQLGNVSSTIGAASAATQVEAEAGTLTLGASNLLADNAGVQIDADATFALGANSDTVGSFTNQGGILDGTGTLTATNYNLFGGTVNANLGAGTLFVNSGSPGAIASTLNGSSAATNVQINNAAVLVLGGAERLADTSAVTVIAGGQLTLGGTETVGSLSGGGTVVLGANTFNAGGNNASTAFSGVLSSTTGGGLTKAGTGTLILSGANSYNGTTTVTGGTLQGTSTSISGSSIADNATLAYNQNASGTVGQNISGSGAVTVTGLAAGNALTFAGANTQSGGFKVTDASMVAFTGTNGGGSTEVALQGAGTLVNKGTISGTTTGVSTSAASGTAIVVNAATGTIAGGSYGVQSSGAGAVALTNYGTITGPISVLSTGANGLSLLAGSTTGAITTGTGADTLSLYTGSVTTAAVVDATTGLTLQSAGTHLAASFGAIDLGTGANVLNLRGAGDGTTANGAAASIDLSTVSNVPTITKQDAGTWTLTGAVTASTAAATINAGVGGAPGSGGLLVFAGSGLTGTINVNGATIRATAAGAFGTGTINAIDPTIQYGATGTYANAIVLQSANPATDPTTLQTYGTGIAATLSGAITQAAGGAAQPLVFSSINTDGTPGTGTFVLTNAGNAWTGVTTVNAGTTLQGTTATLSGASFTDNGVLAFNQGVAGTSARAISGSGTVLITGGGPVSLTGAITAQGGVQVGTATTATLSNVSGTGNTTVTLSGDNAVLNVVAGGTIAATNGGAVFGTAQNGTVNNAGTITSTGNFNTVYFSPNLGTATVANTGTVSAANGSAVYAGAGTTLTVNNTGTLTSANRPAILAAGAASVTNGAAGTINGFFGVYANGALTLTNAGQITAAGAGGNAVTANGGGTIVNTGTLSATTAGGWGVQMSGAGSVDNQGTINADSGLVSTSSAAPSFTNEGTITAASNGVWGYGTAVTLTNTGTITGGGSTGTAGVRAEAAGSSIANSGTIQASSTAGVGVYMTGGTLTNRSGGTISGGTVAGGGYGTAIQLAGTGNMLALQAGSTVNGRIDASGTTDGSNSYTFSGSLNGGFTGGSGNDTVTLVTPVTVTGTLDGGAGIDTLVLDGTGAGTLGSAQVVNVENGVKQGSGTWTLTGTTAASPTAFAINAGTLAVAGGNALADTSAVTIASAGTLQLNASETIGSLAGAGNVALGANTLTTGGLNASPTFAGVIAGSGGLTKVGTGTLTLSGANTYTGATTVNGGTLALGASNVIPDASAVGVATGATLNMGANSDTVASLALSGTLAGTGTLTAATYTLNGATVTANLGAGTLTQAGGTSVLNGTAGAATVNVNGGTLSLGASDRLADTAALSVASGATLNMGAFTDTVGTAALSGTLAGTGTLTAATYTLNGATVTANLGAGTLTQAGGTSVLNGTAGAATVNVNAGTLALGASNRLADNATVMIANGAILDLGANSDTVGLAGIAGTLNGTGTLSAAEYDLSGATVNANLGAGNLFQQAGTSTLNGTAGAANVTVSAGTLVLGASNRLADNAAVGVATGATLNLGANSDTVGTLALNGTLAGTGTLTAATYTLNAAAVNANLGTGTLVQAGGTSVLSGTAATTMVAVMAGTLRLGASDRIADSAMLGVATGATFDLAGYNETVGTLAGSGTLALGAGTLSAGGTNADYAFGGTVTGTGDLTKVGTGTFSLVGNEPMTGRLNVNAGTLMLAGTTAGSVRVQGGTLTGSSAIAGNLLLSSGTLSPGIATQPVGMIQAGSLTVSGGTTVFDFGGMASGFTADLLKVTGAATLTGGTVTTRGLDSSANYKMEQTYTVVQAGSLTGTYASGSTFTQVSNNSDLYYRLRYDLVANGVVLEVRKPVDFTTTLGTGATGNQLAIAGALNGGVLTGSDAFVTALNAISQLSPDQRRSTLDNIGGESIADISTSVALVGNRFNALLRQRVAVGAAGNSADPSLIAGIAGGRRGLDQVRASGQVGAQGSSFADGHADNHAGAWVQTFGGAGTLDGLGGTASIKDQSYGVAAGIDAKVAGLSIGGAFAASALDTRVEGRSATNRGTLYQGGGYVAYDDGTAYASAVGSYFSGDVTSTRQVYIGSAFQGTATGTPRVTGYTAGGSAGYRLPIGGGVRFTPQASFQATHVARDAFTETGAGVLSLSAARDVRTLYTATAEGRLSYLSAAPGGIVEPYVGAGAAFAFGDLNTLSANRFTGAPTGTGAFSVTGARLSPTTALVNGGIEAHPNDRVTLGMGVEGRLSNRQRDGRVELHVRLGF